MALELAGLVTAEEAAVLAQLRKAKAEQNDPRVAAEAALTRLAKRGERVGVSFAQSYSEVLQTTDGRQLYALTRGEVAIADPEKLLVSLAKIAS
jgi:hypothetical protein